MVDSEYTAASIQVLEGLEAVRKRPAMYIGSVASRGLHHLVQEVVDNSIDEAMAGHCDTIHVAIGKDESITVRDNGRGIPVETHPQYGESALQVIMTRLHSGGKFDHSVYKTSGGLHGVGLAVVNALSQWLWVEVRRDGRAFKQTYIRGQPSSGLIDAGVTEISSETGTAISFLADLEIFEEVSFQFERLQNRMRELAFLNRGVAITITDERTGAFDEFKAKEGISAFVLYLSEGKETLHDPIHFTREKDDVIVEVALQWNQAYIENTFSYCNNINTVEGGTHYTGFKSALTRVINAYGRTAGLLKEKDSNLKGEDIREGICAIISVKVPEPQFEGQTKTKLGNSEVEGIVSSVVYDQMTQYLEQNPKISRIIVEKNKKAAEARMAARKARELVQKKVITGTLPGKLSDCSEKDPNLRELFIVEGDSAGGSAIQGRDRKTQAILPLRGKILNTWRAQQHRIYKNNEISSLITAIGAGVGDARDDKENNNGEEDLAFDLGSARYSKIIVLCDADVDGEHIQTLLLTFFYRYMRPLVEAGKVYLAQPPLFGVRKGSKINYAFNENELEDLRKKLGPSKSLRISRFKGLGEMNPDDLWETTMNPVTRTLVQVTLDDSIRAQEMFDRLMGDDPEKRREFIEDRARLAEIDV
ncbi:MAG: type IIA DNA topoisomerase subunit B [Candidatus Heimdallarchaeota archaeon]